MPELLKQSGVHTHLASDHFHYWEDGGCTYHPRYSTWHFARGQEGDPWIGQVTPPPALETEFELLGAEPGPRRQDLVNRPFTNTPETFPMHATFRNGIEFIQRNKDADNWFLQLETFDPHEPFTSLPEHKEPYADHYARYRGKPAYWPPYRPVRESRDVVDHTRHDYAALVTACDRQLGQVLDLFDKLNLWEDTLLIVWTDHGFLLGEHDSWGKCWTQFYNEIAHTPFFVWDPRCPAAAGTRRSALVQPAIDLAPTLLRFFGQEVPPSMLGQDLAAAIAEDRPVREYALFGLFGGQVNITDGRFVYMRGSATPDNRPLNQYTLMPTHMRDRFSTQELNAELTLAPPFSFTKGCPVLRIPVSGAPPVLGVTHQMPTLFFDLEKDPGQEHPISHSPEEARLTQALIAEMHRCDAPPEQFIRLGLENAAPDA